MMADLERQLGTARRADPDGDAPLRHRQRRTRSWKELTRGQRVSREGMQAFVQGLEIPEAAKAELLKLTPWDYTGKAAELAKRI